MKIFFGGYVLLLVGVFVLWSIEPLHRAQEASSISSSAPFQAKVATASSTVSKVTTPPPAKKPVTVASVDTKTEESGSTLATAPANEPNASTTTQATTTVSDSPQDSTPAEAPHETAEQALSVQIEAGIHAKINEARVAAGLTPLSYNALLTTLARSHSTDMLDNNYFSHNDAAGCSSSCRLTNTGFAWSLAGENIYLMNGYMITIDKAVDMVVNGWMDSPGHRANILNPAFKEEGIGIAFLGSKLYATEDFATPLK